jgi:HPt (histidine-containing phosphotransfer) domain-containing protein
MNDLSLVENVSRQFQSQAAESVAAMQQSWQAGDGGGVKRTAHKLKGSAGLISAADLAELAAKIEHFARDSELTQIQPVLEQLRLEMDRVIDWLPKVVERARSGATAAAQDARKG